MSRPLHANFVDHDYLNILGSLQFNKCVYLMLSGIYCYACNSYLGQCGERVDNSKGTVFRSRCSGPCFARRGEDDGKPRSCCLAIYAYMIIRYCIGVASYGALGHVPPPLDFQFFVTSESHKLLLSL